MAENRFKRYGKKFEKHNKNENQKFTSTKSFKIGLIVVLAVLFVVIGLNIQNLSPSNIVNWVQGSILGMNHGSGFPCEIVGSKVDANNFAIFDNDISYTSDTSFVALNKSAAEDVNRQHSFSNPIYKSTNNYALIYNLGTKSFQLEKKSKTVLKANLDNNIICGSVSQNGKCAFITGSNDYLSEMVVLSSKNGEVKEEYKYYFSEYYITNVAISSDGKSGVACGIYSDAGVLKSAVYIFNFNSETPKEIIEYNDNMIIDLQYGSNGKAVAIFDKSASIINTSKKTHVDYSYENKSLLCYEIQDGIISLALSETSTGGSGKVVVLDLSGNQRAMIDTDVKVLSVSSYGNKIAILSDSQVYEYTSGGSKRNSFKVSGDSKKIKLAKNNKLYILGICKISTLHLT